MAWPRRKPRPQRGPPRAVMDPRRATSTFVGELPRPSVGELQGPSSRPRCAAHAHRCAPKACSGQRRRKGTSQTDGDRFVRTTAWIFGTRSTGTAKYTRVHAPIGMCAHGSSTRPAPVARPLAVPVVELFARCHGGGSPAEAASQLRTPNTAPIAPPALLHAPLAHGRFSKRANTPNTHFKNTSPRPRRRAAGSVGSDVGAGVAVPPPTALPARAV